MSCISRLPIWFLATVLSLAASGLSSLGDEPDDFSFEDEPDASTIDSGYNTERDQAVDEPGLYEAAADTRQARTELIQERYPNTKIKIERYVTQDSNGNFVNNGSWKHFDEQGQVIAEGEYRFGRQHGNWVRWFRADEGPMFGRLFEGFQRPFKAKAAFNDGKLDGKWTVSDATGQHMCEWSFDNGRPEGEFTWWYPGGAMRRLAHYKSGVLDGELTEWKQDKSVLGRDQYLDGRKLIAETKWYGPKAKQSEDGYLVPVGKMAFDWMAGTAQAGEVDGKDKMRHGGTLRWHPNGVKMLEGRYEKGQPVGEFTWWFSNGQKSAQGKYADGKEHGKWDWWFANGQLKSEGEYTHGKPIGKWATWNEEGKLVSSQQPKPGNDKAASQKTNKARTGQRNSPPALDLER